jgi:uncharacterized HhH-GPD family protein
MAGTAQLRLTGDAAGDALLSSNPFALIVGMMLDQQIRMEIAFLGPHRLAERLGVALTPHAIASAASDDLEAAFRVKPAIHRFPGAMAGRVRKLAEAIVDGYDGDAEAVWRDVTDASVVHARLAALPGFGDEKASIFMALLAKQLDVRPRGWKAATGEYGLKGYRSIADVTDPDSLLLVRESKQAVKAAERAAAD